MLTSVLRHFVRKANYSVSGLFKSEGYRIILHNHLPLVKKPLSKHQATRISKVRKRPSLTSFHFFNFCLVALKHCCASVSWKGKETFPLGSILSVITNLQFPCPQKIFKIRHLTSARELSRFSSQGSEKQTNKKRTSSHKPDLEKQRSPESITPQVLVFSRIVERKKFIRK